MQAGADYTIDKGDVCVRGLTDIHTHILPGVDDGAKTLSESLAMLQMEYEDGVRRVILTPHYRKGLFETDMSVIEKRFRQLCEAAASKLGDMKLYLGCEYHADMDMTETLKTRKQACMAGGRYVLTEFSETSDKFYIRERISRLQSCGYRPIIAHAERCGYLRKDISYIEELVEMGAGVQVNAGSITGEEGIGIAMFCRKLMKRDLIHFIGTDSHGTKKRKPNMGACAAYLEKKMGTEYAERILCRNPEKIFTEGV